MPDAWPRGASLFDDFGVPRPFPRHSPARVALALAGLLGTGDPPSCVRNTLPSPTDILYDIDVTLLARVHRLLGWAAMTRRHGK